MLFTDMKCFSCGNPPQESGEGITSFYASRNGLLEVRSSESYVIDLCDSCLTEGGRQGRVCRTITENRPPNYYEYTWNPDGEDKAYRMPPPVFYPIVTEKKAP